MKYQILGDTLPVVVCQLEGGEKMITESGSMSWMSPNMKMETTSNGGIGKALGRMFAGEHIFQNIFCCFFCQIYNPHRSSSSHADQLFSVSAFFSAWIR